MCHIIGDHHGSFWGMKIGGGRFYFLNVPPYLARSPEELLLPVELLE